MFLLFPKIRFTCGRRRKTTFRLLLMPVFFFLAVSAGIAMGQDVEDIFPSIKSSPPDRQESPAKQESLPKKEEPQSEGKTPPAISPFFDRLLSRIEGDLTWGGYIRNETAFRFVNPSAFDKVLNILQLEGHYRLFPKIQLSGRLHAFYDAAYDLESVDTISPRKGPDTILTANLSKEEVARLNADNVRNVDVVKRRIELRELYLDMNFQNLDLRIGRQIVRWGVVEGARVTDEINPLDFYELILRDIDDRYIPLFMAKANLYVGSDSFEAILIPEIRGHRPAPMGS